MSEFIVSRNIDAFQRATFDNEQESVSCPKPSACSCPKSSDASSSLSGSEHWSYLYLRGIKVGTFESQLRELRKKRDGVGDVDEASIRHLRLLDDSGNSLYIPNVFVHKRHTHVKARHGVRACEEVSVSGLVFVQGTVSDIQRFFSYNYPRLRLYSASRHSSRVARISHSRMVPFMRALDASPDRIRILNRLLSEVVKDKPLVRMLSGDFSGVEGHIVRIRGDRNLVFGLDSGITVCIGRIHKDEYELVDAEIVDGRADDGSGSIIQIV